MHMADALLSPAVGGAMWAATAGTIALASRRLKRDLDDSTIPLMGVLGAFVFAAQMINFTIPGTGSSGHLGGGMILAILLGPWAGFLTMASVLTVQALFFADGGLLALGCNIFNLGVFPCFVAYPLIYRPLAGATPSRNRILAGSVAASVIGLQLGAFSVVLETFCSGMSELPFAAFALLMEPIHLAIGLVEGLITAAVVGFIWKARPETLGVSPAVSAPSLRRVLTGLALAAVIAGGGLSWFASERPDGLEWAVLHAAGTENPGGGEQESPGVFADLQARIAVLPDYGFRDRSEYRGDGRPATSSAWPAADAGTSLAGLLGGGLTLLFATGAGLLLRWRRRASAEHC